MPKASQLIKPVAAIVCDDIRQESNLKEILIGIYTGDLLLRRSPSRLRLCVYLLVEISEIGKGEFELRLNGPDGPSENTARINFESVAPTIPKHRIGLSFNNMWINISKEGLLAVEFRRIGGRWIKAAALPVNLGPKTVISSNET